MKKYTCKTCENTFFSYNVNPSFCNLNCKGIYQIKDLPEKEIIKSYINGKTLIEIKKIYGGSQKSITNVLKRNNVDLRKAVKRDQKGDKNSFWKGNDAKYAGVHRRVKSAFGNPKKCEWCLTEENRRYEWACIGNDYWDIKSYVRLCVPCHRNYDKNREIKPKMPLK